MTLPPSTPAESSSPVTAAGFGAAEPAATGYGTGRTFTEPLRELSALALLAANAVLLFVAFSRLFFVGEQWASEFGLRCALVFGDFVGPVSLGLPLLAVLLATHVAPMVPRFRLVLLAALVEFGVSAVFGLAAFLGAFAHEVSAFGVAVEGVLERGVWLGLLVLACLLVGRIWMGMFPSHRPLQPYGTPVTYGRPYPGQPVYPDTNYQTGVAAPAYDEPTIESGWPLVPAPPRPEPLVVETASTVTQPTPPADPLPEPPDVGAEATQLLRPPAPTADDSIEPPTRKVDR